MFTVQQYQFPCFNRQLSFVYIMFFFPGLILTGVSFFESLILLDNERECYHKRMRRRMEDDEEEVEEAPVSSRSRSLKKSRRR